MAFGLSSKVRRPSSSLKKKLMVRLELHRDSMDILKIVLRINETQGRTVQEVIALAEEKDGELFLDTWRFIFELLSLTKDFEKLVDADHWQLTDPIKTLESPLHNQHARDAYHNTCKRSVQENAPYSNKPEEPLSNKLKEPRINNRKVSRLETQKTRSSSENWPEWSLPPPSEDSLSQETWKETSMEMGDDKAGERTVSSDGQNLQQFWNDNPPLLSPAPLPAVVPASQLEQSAAPDTSVTEKEEGRSSTWQINSGQGLSSGLSSKVRRPSSSLKKKLMVRLELHRDSMDILKIVLRINETQGKTVQEVIALAEEKDGELFLDTWRLIFELLSLTKDFEKLVDADHWPLTNSIKTLENALQDQHARDANFNTCKRSPQENAPCRVSRLEAQKTKSSFKNGPERSLPPPPEDNLSRETWKETTFIETRDDDTEHQNLVVDEAGEGTVSSDGQNLQQFWGGDTDESIDKEDHSGSACQIDTIPSLYSVDSRTSSTGTRPVTPEPVGRLTGHQLHLNQEASQENDLVGETCPSVTDDATENSDNFQQSPRERSLELEAYQLELQWCEQQCAQQQGTINELQGILYDSIFLEAENQQLIRMTQELNEMKDQEIEQLTQLCGQKDQDYERMAELCDQKDQDNERLAEEIERLRGEHRQEIESLRGEHRQDIDRLKGENRQETDRLRGEFVQMIHQMDQRSKCSQTQIENLRRERQELSEELQQIGAEVRESHERKLELEAELECMRRDNETLLDQRMTELEQAFLNAESDEIKIMKQELAKEKRKRRETEETIKGLFKVQAMENELMLRGAELMESSGSVVCADGVQEDPGSSSTESTVVEAGEESDDGEEVF